jgi:gamma-glutamylcysteine synthetase
MTESAGRRREGQMPRKRPANGKEQLNVWISSEAKRYLDERSEREDRHLNELIEEYIQKDMAVHRGEIVEQQSLPVISEIVDTKLRKAMAQLRTDLREDMQLDILEPMKTVSRNSDDRLASLIVRAVRDAGIIRRLLYALVAKTFGAEFAQDAYENAKARSGQELAARTTAWKEKEAE